MKKSQVSLLLATAFIAWACPNPSVADCVPSWSAPAGIPGTELTVNAMVTWDPDGDGPESEWLVLGGHFDFAGDVSASKVAAWDGNQWHAFGTGMNGDVNTLTVHEGQLIVGGEFTTANGTPCRYVAKWTGTTFEPFGNGPGVVWSLASYNGQLIAGRSSDTKYWDGDSWETFAGGINGVQVLKVIGGDLYAGGSFATAGGVSANSIARWDGIQWHAYGSGFTSKVWSLTVYEGQLVVGGQFSGFIKTWNGVSWTVLGGGAENRVYSLEVHNGNLYAGGSFLSVNGVAADRIASWDGESWHSAGGGMGGTSSRSVRALCPYQGELIAGGYFRTAGGSGVENVGRWDGTIWRRLSDGFNHLVDSLYEFDNKLIVGGHFRSAGDIDAAGVAAWSGQAWTDFGEGFQDSNSTSGPAVYCLGEFNGDLIAGGDFHRSGNTVLNGIGRWNGTEWDSLTTGVDGEVRAVLQVGGDLIIGGDFHTAGGVTARSIARWDGESWHPISPELTCNGCATVAVYALAELNGDVILGGQFTKAGGITLNHVAIWDGLTIASMNQGFDGFVRALCIYNGTLIAGGDYYYANGQIMTHVAQWQDGQWYNVGNGIPTFSSYPVQSLASYRSVLYAGGQYSLTDPYSTKNILKWDGSAWSSLQSGTDAYVAALRPFKDSLFVGGGFTSAGGLIAGYLAKWTDPYPETVPPPAYVSECEGRDTALHVETSAVDVTDFQWLKEDEALQDSAHYQGAHTATLSIFQLSPSDAGEYTCILIHPECGEYTIPATVVAVFPSGTGDGTADGITDARDLQPFIGELLQTTLNDGGRCAFDMNGDGSVGSEDIPLFVDLILGGV